MAAPIVPEDFGGESLENGIRMHGWKFETSEGAIVNTAELASLKKRLHEQAGTDDPLPRLPEAVFGKNSLKMTHEPSGYTLSFDAEGALVEWLRNSLKEGAGGLTVPLANVGSWKDKVQQQDEESKRPDWDWTYSTSYSGVGADVNDEPLPWAAHSGAGIDMALLRRRDPILFFADLPLYQDDLHDNGHTECRLRVRVMPTCFFVLLRHFLRVDGLLIRQRDTRIFCKWGGGGGGGGVAVSADSIRSSVVSPPTTLLRMLRAGKCDLPPLPLDPQEGRLVDGGSEDTPRPPILGTSILPDEQVAAQRLESLPPEYETVEELALLS